MRMTIFFKIFILLSLMILGCDEIQSPTELGDDSNAQKPLITDQPKDQQVIADMDAVFSIIASGNNLFYQWESGDSILEGQNIATLTLAGVIVADSGSQYRCIVSNDLGEDTSDFASLFVWSEITVPVITTEPINQSVTVEADVEFSIEAEGALLTYQWQRNDINIAGANSSNYELASTSIDDSGDIFRCIVKNSAGSDTSKSVTLIVKEPSIVGTWIIFYDGVDSFSLTDTTKDMADIMFKFTDSTFKSYFWIGYKSWNSYNNYMMDPESAMSSGYSYTVSGNTIEIDYNGMSNTLSYILNKDTLIINDKESGSSLSFLRRLNSAIPQEWKHPTLTPTLLTGEWYRRSDGTNYRREYTIDIKGDMTFIETVETYYINSGDGTESSDSGTWMYEGDIITTIPKGGSKDEYVVFSPTEFYLKGDKNAVYKKQ